MPKWAGQQQNAPQCCLTTQLHFHLVENAQADGSDRWQEKKIMVGKCPLLSQSKRATSTANTSLPTCIQESDCMMIGGQATSGSCWTRSRK
mmetsp:Transcript_49796/g.98828  ORF Transcript_49796/g.98828 Transcript_49796/m.98828 type:complete len:91 (-) Transcript_49796:1934-2206(-)